METSYPPSPSKIKESFGILIPALGEVNKEKTWKSFVSTYFPDVLDEKPEGMTWERFYADLYDFDTTYLYLVLQGTNYATILINNYNILPKDLPFDINLEALHLGRKPLVSDDGYSYLPVKRKYKSTYEYFLMFFETWLEERKRIFDKFYYNRSYQDWISDFGTDPKYYESNFPLTESSLLFIHGAISPEEKESMYSMELASSARTSPISPLSSPLAKMQISPQRSLPISPKEEDEPEYSGEEEPEYSIPEEEYYSSSEE